MSEPFDDNVFGGGTPSFERLTLRLMVDTYGIKEVLRELATICREANSAWRRLRWRGDEMVDPDRAGDLAYDIGGCV